MLHRLTCDTCAVSILTRDANVLCTRCDSTMLRAVTIIVRDESDYSDAYDEFVNAHEVNVSKVESREQFEALFAFDSIDETAGPAVLVYIRNDKRVAYYDDDFFYGYVSRDAEEL